MRKTFEATVCDRCGAVEEAAADWFRFRAPDDAECDLCPACHAKFWQWWRAGRPGAAAADKSAGPSPQSQGGYARAAALDRGRRKGHRCGSGQNTMGEGWSMTRAHLIEILARGICVGEMMNPDDALGGWRHWTAAAAGALAELADNDLAIVSRMPTPHQLAAGWAAINKGRTKPVDMAPGPALREAWPAMIDEALR